MENKVILFIDKLRKNRKLSLEEYQILLEGYTPEIAEYAAAEAVKVKQLISISNANNKVIILFIYFSFV